MIAAARVFVLVLLGVFATADVVSAKTITSTATEWGLLGTWRIDCSAPPSRADAVLKYVVRAGKLFHDRDWGDGKDSNPVLSASVTGEGGLEVLVKFDSIKQTRQWTLIKGDDGRIRTLSNRNVDTDEYAIRDGKLTANGNTSLWLAHCR
jgi:hypothetical protein